MIYLWFFFVCNCLRNRGGNRCFFFHHSPKALLLFPTCSPLFLLKNTWYYDNCTLWRMLYFNIKVVLMWSCSASPLQSPSDVCNRENTLSASAEEGWMHRTFSTDDTQVGSALSLLFYQSIALFFEHKSTVRVLEYIQEYADDWPCVMFSAVVLIRLVCPASFIVSSTTSTIDCRISLTDIPNTCSSNMLVISMVQ